MKKVICVLTCVMLLFAVMPMNVFAEEMLLAEVKMPAPYYAEASQAEALETIVDLPELADYLIEQAYTCPESIDITSFGIKYSEENMNALNAFIQYETPELFHIDAISFLYYPGGNIAILKPDYDCTAEEYQVQYNDMVQAGEILLKDVKGNDSLSDVEKALILHDRLAVWTEYDSQGIMGQRKYTPHAVLVNQMGVCMGYALAYDYLLEQVGIESYYCDSRSLNHAWNIVIIDGVEYHVDVTHDDPTNDRTGRVRHINFLRSTDGIKSTSHNATDFVETPNDTRYDNYYWQNSDAAFQLIDNEIYYIDSNSATINKLTSTGSQTLVSGLDKKWFVSGTSGSYYPGCYSLLSSDGTDLYYSNARNIHKYDISAGTTSVVWDLTSSQYKIYGFKWENCQFICDMNDSPNFTLTTKADNGLTKEHHAEGGQWVIESFATSGSNGVTSKECAGCGEISYGTTATKASFISSSSGVTLDGSTASLFTKNRLINSWAKLIYNSPESVNPSHTAAGNSFYGTGSEIVLKTGANETVKLTVIVDGDLNGDSVCDVLDAQLASLYLNQHDEPTNAQIYAANGTSASEIDIASYQALVNKAVG